MLSERVKSWEKNWMQQGMERGLQRGMEQGLQQGMQEGQQLGRQDGERALLLKQLTHRFGQLNNEVLQRVQHADTTEIERWAENILDAQTLDEVFDIPEQG